MERTRPIERLADALQACLNEAAERGAERAAERAAQRAMEVLTPRFDRQDETLHLIWKQVKGTGRLPIDD
jgi:hypothetical protein